MKFSYKNMKGGMSMNNKKGVSAVVATVLIIVITIAAVAIIGTTIIPMLKNKLEEGTVCLDASTALMIENKGYTCYNAEVDIDVQVSHGAKDVDLVGIQFLISEGGNTASVSETTITNLPTPNGAKVMSIPYTSSAPDSVAIAAIVKVGNKETTCEVSPAVTLEAC